MDAPLSLQLHFDHEGPRTELRLIAGGARWESIVELPAQVRLGLHLLGRGALDPESANQVLKALLLTPAVAELLGRAGGGERRGLMALHWWESSGEASSLVRVHLRDGELRDVYGPINPAPRWLRPLQAAGRAVGRMPRARRRRWGAALMVGAISWLSVAGSWRGYIAAPAHQLLRPMVAEGVAEGSGEWPVRVLSLPPGADRGDAATALRRCAGLSGEVSAPPGLIALDVRRDFRGSDREEAELLEAIEALLDSETSELITGVWTTPERAIAPLDGEQPVLLGAEFLGRAGGEASGLALALEVSREGPSGARSCLPSLPLAIARRLSDEPLEVFGRPGGAWTPLHIPAGLATSQTPGFSADRDVVAICQGAEAVLLAFSDSNLDGEGLDRVSVPVVGLSPTPRVAISGPRLTAAVVTGLLLPGRLRTWDHHVNALSMRAVAQQVAPCGVWPEGLPPLSYLPSPLWLQALAQALYLGPAAALYLATFGGRRRWEFLGVFLGGVAHLLAALVAAAWSGILLPLAAAGLLYLLLALQEGILRARPEAL